MEKSKRKRQTTVLVIDDDELLLVSLKQLLERNMYVVDTAKTGGEAVEKSKKGSYDAALIDIRLPDINGVDLLLMLQDGRGGLSNAVKIIITGSPSTGSRTKAFERGADAYLEKPVKLVDLLSIIEEKIRSRRSDEN